MYFMFVILLFLRILCDIVCVNHCLWLCFAATQPAAPGDNRVLLAWLLTHTQLCDSRVVPHCLQGLLGSQGELVVSTADCSLRQSDNMF